ncbi:MAG: HAD family hydrolase, partial [bacterium]|nr:HAD family hydrolase [bacterium]
ELYTGEEYFVDQETDLIRAHAEHYLKVPPQVFDLDKLSKKERFLKAVISTVRGENTEKVTADFCKDLAASSVTPACGAVHPNVVFYNITSRWASRRRAFEGLLEYYELQADEIMSFGDAPADETFLKMSGIGIAMDNADPVAKEAANFITKSVEEDGIAQALRILYPLS